MVHGYIILRKKNGSDGPQFPVKKSVRIGRGTHCDVRIHVQSVSEQHCLIIVEKGKKAVIQNLSSNSHTFVNGMPVGKSGHALEHGDTIAVGERYFRWQYGQQTPFFEGKKGSMQKRRKSEADSAIGSQNIAVVNPLQYHKRRTLGPTIPYADTVRSPKIASSDLKSHSAKKSIADRRSGLQTPSKSSPAAKSLAVAGTPTAKAPPITTPKIKSSAKKAPIVKTPGVKSLAALSRSPSAIAQDSPSLTASAQKSATRKTSVRKSSVDHTSATTPEQAMSSIDSATFYASPLLTVQTPSQRSSSVKMSSRKFASKSPASQTPGQTPSKKILFKSPASLTPGRTLSLKKASKSPASRTPGRTPSSQRNASNSPGPRSPVKTPGSKRKPKSAVKSLKISKGQKRRLSSPPPVSAKRIKIASPKSIDKKKMAVLMGIHGKSPRVAQSSTLSSVRVVLSGKKTPVVKPKTPRPSTSKKGTLQHTNPGSKVKSSVKKPRRPLFSEILKKKAVQKANSVVKKLTLVPKAPPRAGVKKAKKTVLSTEIPKTFKFGSTGHANSPEPIVIGRKLAKTPVVTKKGRKVQTILNLQKECINLSGVSEMFQTPAKATPQKGSPVASKALNISKTSLNFSASKKLSSSRSSMKASKESTPVQQKLSPPKSSPVSQKTPVKPASPLKPSTPQITLASKGRTSVSTPASVNTSGRMRATRSAVSESVDRRRPAKAPASPALNRTLSGSDSRKPRSLLTSTPAVRRERESLAETVFGSPSSLLGGQFSAPQSPASGRKSRLEVPLVSYVHSPHASPGKSSLKSSPSKSPPSGGASKNLSVSFNNSIRVKMLVPGSRRSLNTTAPLRSPASIAGEDDSGTATPDITTFDFNSVKTPNVPKEMFVSSIMSSGSSSLGQASGSAKRKGKVVRTPQNDLTNLHGIRRLMKTPHSPAGYVDVKGVKRLMSNASKTPTYLAVEGVKKLFGDAAAAAGNELSNFVGVRELFASPSPKSKPKSPINVTPRSSARKSSPVAKILAEVGSKVVLSPRSPSRTSPQSPPSTKKQSQVASPTKSTPSRTPASRARHGNQTKTPTKPKVPSPQPESSKVLSRGRGRTRKGRSAEEVVSVNPSPSKSPTITSPPKRRTRKATQVASPSVKSPVQESVKNKTRGARKKPAAPAASLSSPKRSSKPSSDDSAKMSSPKREETSPKVKSKRATSRKAVAKASPAIKSSPPKRATRRRDKTSVESGSTKSTKRGLSPSSNQNDSPAKKSKQTVLKVPSPVKSPPKRATRRTKKEISPKREASPKQFKETSAKKRKVTFNEEVVTPAKKGKTASTRKASSSSVKSSPEKSIRSKRTGSKKNETQVKEVSAPSKKKTSTKTTSPKVSPRRTRSRK